MDSKDRSASNRNLLKESLRKILEGKPLSKITVDEISGEAGISRKAFYSYFSNKYELLHQIVFDDSVLPLLQLTQHLPQMSNDASRKIIMEAFYSGFLREKSFYSNLARRRPDRYELLESLIDCIGEVNSASLAQYETDNPDKPFIAYYFASAQAMMILKWIDEGMVKTPSEMYALYDEFIYVAWDNALSLTSEEKALVPSSLKKMLDPL